MKPSMMTIYELFERQKRYVVPLFQRPYVWTQEGQWESLWEDIAAKAEEQMHDPNQRRPHFLGAIVLNQRSTFGKELAASDIIDGQQRLTTFQLILAAFRDLVTSIGDGSLHGELVRLTENSGIQQHAYEVFKVWPTNADRAVLEEILKARSLAQVNAKFPPKVVRRKPQPRLPLVEAYVFFYEAIENWAHDPQAEPGAGEIHLSVDRLDALFAALRRMLQVVVIELEDQDDPQVIFETLNATGVPLLPSDLIRNFVFLRASRENVEVDDLYEKWWKEYDERRASVGVKGEDRFWKIKEQQGRMFRPRIDLFVVHYLAYRREREVAHSYLFKEFRDWYELKRDRVVADELQDLRRYSDVFATFIEPETSTRLGQFEQRLRILDTSMVYPLLLFLLVEKREELEGPALTQIITDLESYLVRRMVCNLTPKNYNRFFPYVLRSLRQVGGNIPDALRRVLLEETAETSRWPDDRDFERAWLQNPAYEAYDKTDRVSMILRALDAAMNTPKTEPYVHTSSLSIEHVMPQAWREKWPKPSEITALLPDDETAEERRDRLIHSYGNLTLVTQPLNSAMRDNVFDVKRPEIALKSRLNLNAVFQTAITWDETSILQRGRDLFYLAQQIWPYPG